MSKIISIILAVSFSFLLFVGMTFLIKPKAMEVEEQSDMPPITITFDIVDKEPPHRIRIPPTPVIKPKPKMATTIKDTRKPAKEKMVFERVAFNQNTIEVGIVNGIGMGKRGDGEAMPRVRINPRYPQEAAEKGIEGYVVLTFDISKMGTTENISVIDANPRGIFEKQARKALRKWKYSPKIVNEQAVAQLGQRITLQFNLESELL